MQLRCRTHAVWAWPPLTLSSSLHQSDILPWNITFNQPGDVGINPPVMHKEADMWNVLMSKQWSLKLIYCWSYWQLLLDFQWYFCALNGEWMRSTVVAIQYHFMRNGTHTWVRVDMLLEPNPTVFRWKGGYILPSTDSHFKKSRKDYFLLNQRS